ncbi:alpha/beta fold hydrolase [Yoonia sp.]|jgi:homoserine O-acetyltransferase/O-succinyltransferase|uniref:alpha/beta fold hydrolase n=1 Tax=Yoonia sp. TaxID=2212373 RepID=UPI004048E1B5
MGNVETFALGDLTLQSGAVLPDARLAYETQGMLTPARDNAIILPTFYGGRSADYRAMIGPGRALDPDHWFIIVVNMFGNGVSSSPSNTPAPHSGPDFPAITHWDNVHAQRRLVRERFGIERLALATGFSMGGQQANHWAALFPDMVARLAPWCGSARTSPHNWVFLEGPKAALLADTAFAEGHYDAPPEKGIRAFARVWAGWGPSQAFYRDGLYRALGHASPAAHISEFWEANFLAFDANDLLAMLSTWQNSDISANTVYGGTYADACAAITARTVLLPGATDLYFPVEDNRIQKSLMTAPCALTPIPSDWGHIAGGPGVNAIDMAFLDAALIALLDTPATR